MSISSVQKQRKTKEFQEQLLKIGIEPNNYEITRMLAEYFGTHTLGMPCYSPILQKPYEESSKQDYNHNFKTFQEDIETVYEASTEANNKAIAVQQYYDLEKNKICNAISKLQLRVEGLTEAISQANHIKQYVQVFDDLYDIEYYGNTARNLPYTTAFIDLLQKKVYTDKTINKSNKISLSNAIITVKDWPHCDNIQCDGNKNNLLSDTLTDMYTIVCQSKIDEAKELTIVIDIGEIVDCNTVSFQFASVKQMQCSLSLSEDNVNYIAVYDNTGRDLVEWHFTNKKIRYVKIVCTKQEPDGVTKLQEQSYYEYYYILKNISIFRDIFDDKSIFVSKEISFNDLTSTIRLDATEKIFNNTRIDYFIGFDNGVSKIGWEAIDNHSDFKLFMFDYQRKILNAHVDETFGELNPTIGLYRLYDIPKNVNINSIKLTAGYNMWSVKRYNHKQGDSSDIAFTLANSDFSEYVAQCNMTQLFMDCDNYDSFKIQTNVLYTFTQYIQLEQAQNIYDVFIKLIDDTHKEISCDLRIFINGYETVKTDTGTYSFAFKKGVNKIQMALYCKQNKATRYTLYHNLNTKTITNDVFAFTPMKYVNYIALSKTINDTYSYYTIKNRTIYVKCNPQDMIQSELEDMGYYITYSALRNDMQQYFKDNRLRFRIMAVLNSTDRYLSPELINFRITGK